MTLLCASRLRLRSLAARRTHTQPHAARILSRTPHAYSAAWRTHTQPTQTFTTSIQRASGTPLSIASRFRIVIVLHGPSRDAYRHLDLESLNSYCEGGNDPPGVSPTRHGPTRDSYRHLDLCPVPRAPLLWPRRLGEEEGCTLVRPVRCSIVLRGETLVALVRRLVSCESRIPVPTRRRSDALQ